MFLRYLKASIEVERRSESLRELLFSHRSFSVCEVFELIDRESNGVIEVTELEAAFSKAECPCDSHLAREMVKVVDQDKNGKIDLQELSDAVMPFKAEYRTGGPLGSAELSFE